MPSMLMWTVVKKILLHMKERVEKTIMRIHRWEEVPTWIPHEIFHLNGSRRRMGH